ncbi:hypothetical protein ABH899_002094 [Paenibacillus sp. RC84]
MVKGNIIIDRGDLNHGLIIYQVDTYDGYKKVLSFKSKAEI